MPGAPTILVDPAIDAEYRQKKPPCKHCGSDAYTRFRYFNNKNAVLNRYRNLEEGTESCKQKLQGRFACRSPKCLANNPGKKEVEFTDDGKTRKPYAKRPRPAANPKSNSSTTASSSKRLKPSQQQQHQVEVSEPSYSFHHGASTSNMYYGAGDASTYQYGVVALGVSAHMAANPMDAYNYCSQFTPEPYAPLSTLPALLDNVHKAQLDDAAPSSSVLCDADADVFSFSELLATATGKDEDPHTCIQLQQEQEELYEEDGCLQELDALLMKDDDEEDVLRRICCDSQWMDANPNLFFLLQGMEEDLRRLL